MGMTVGHLWHYPVKSMQGQVVDEVVLGPGGVLGERAYGFVDAVTGRLLSAKHPKRYGPLLACRAEFTRPPSAEEPSPPVRVTFPDGQCLEDDPDGIAKRVGVLLGADVRMVTSVEPGVPYEEVWPELDGFGPDAFYGALQITSARRRRGRRVDPRDPHRARRRRHPSRPRRRGAAVLEVTDAETADAMRLLHRTTHNMPEPAGAIALAGLRADPHPGKKLAVVMTGGNADTDLYAPVLSGTLP